MDFFKGVQIMGYFSQKCKKKKKLRVKRIENDPDFESIGYREL